MADETEAVTEKPQENFRTYLKRTGV